MDFVSTVYHTYISSCLLACLLCVISSPICPWPHIWLWGIFANAPGSTVAVQDVKAQKTLQKTKQLQELGFFGWSP